MGPLLGAGRPASRVRGDTMRGIMNGMMNGESDNLKNPFRVEQHMFVVAKSNPSILHVCYTFIVNYNMIVFYEIIVG